MLTRYTRRLVQPLSNQKLCAWEDGEQDDYVMINEETLDTERPGLAGRKEGWMDGGLASHHLYFREAGFPHFQRGVGEQDTSFTGYYVSTV